MDSPLFVKSKQFALDIIKVYNKEKIRKEKVYLQINLLVSESALVGISGCYVKNFYSKSFFSYIYLVVSDVMFCKVLKTIR